MNQPKQYVFQLDEITEHWIESHREKNLLIEYRKPLSPIYTRVYEQNERHLILKFFTITVGLKSDSSPYHIQLDIEENKFPNRQIHFGNLKAGTYATLSVNFEASESINPDDMLNLFEPFSPLTKDQFNILPGLRWTLNDKVDLVVHEQQIGIVLYFPIYYP